ncbi:phosphatidylserine decarboxylase [Helicobacter sp. 23-1044]
MAKFIVIFLITALFCVAIYALNWSKIISLCFGAVANLRFPATMQSFINAKYVAFFNISLSEFPPLESYKSLNELFTRGLRKMRDFDKQDNIIISPSDSLVIESGKVAQGRALQIKGFSYEVAPLLGVSARDLPPNLYYANLYLSPRDYHRYHAPCDMFVESIVHFRGKLLPVHQKSLNKNQNLFIRNERVVVSGRMKNGAKIYFVAVGALNVGQIVFYVEPKLQEKFSEKKREFFYKEPKFVRKGEELGMFKMGSTIVLFVEASGESSGNSSLTRPILPFAREFEKFSLDKPSVLSRSNFSAQPTKQGEAEVSLSNLAQDTRIAEDTNDLSLRDSAKQNRGNPLDSAKSNKIAESSEKSSDSANEADSAPQITIFKQGEKIRFGEALFKLN